MPQLTTVNAVSLELPIIPPIKDSVNPALTLIDSEILPYLSQYLSMKNDEVLVLQ